MGDIEYDNTNLDAAFNNGTFDVGDVLLMIDLHFPVPGARLVRTCMCVHPCIVLSLVAHVDEGLDRVRIDLRTVHPKLRAWGRYHECAYAANGFNM